MIHTISKSVSKTVWTVLMGGGGLSLKNCHGRVEANLAILFVCLCSVILNSFQPFWSFLAWLRMVHCNQSCDYSVGAGDSCMLYAIINHMRLHIPSTEIMWFFAYEIHNRDKNPWNTYSTCSGVGWRGSELRLPLGVLGVCRGCPTPLHNHVHSQLP